jgi:hypothetical protein
MLCRYEVTNTLDRERERERERVGDSKLSLLVFQPRRAHKIVA